MKTSYRSLLFRGMLCVGFTSLLLFFYIDKQNEVVELKRNIPLLIKELKKIEEENSRLQYEIDQFESPVHLLELARKPEYGHLKYPSTDNVLIIENSP